MRFFGIVLFDRGLQLATNVRILPSDEPFPTVVKMAEDSYAFFAFP